MTKEKSWGIPIQAAVATDRFPTVWDGFSLDPREAASLILSAYLERLVFYRPSPDQKGEPFMLEKVLPVWPDSTEMLAYPSASVVEDVDVDYGAHNLTPTCLEATANRYAPETVLWKTDELAVDFRVDFWTTSDPERQAIAARLPAAFSPTEIRSGVLLSGHPCYWDLPARATLLRHRRVDDSASAYARERRLTAVIRVDLDVVHLRQIRPLDPRLLLSVADPKDPPAEPITEPVHFRS